MEFLSNVIDFFFQHPVWSIVAAILILWLLLGLAAAASDSSGSSGGRSSYSSPSSYTSQMSQTGTAARQRMDRTSAAYRSRVRNTLRR
jgi:hypothetical protein